MNSRTDSMLIGFDDAVLERWGLKPTAKDTLTRAKERGAISPQEITEMISTALAKDRQKMAEVLQELKKILQNLNISVTFNVLHTHTHIVQSPTVVTTAPASKPKPQPKTGEQTVPPLATAKGPQYAGEGHESPFLNAKLLGEQGLVPDALGILLVAKARGYISPQQIGTLIPAEISQDNAKLRTTMRWITQLLGAIEVKIVIGSVHVKRPESQSPETSYSVRPENPSSRKGRLPVLFNSTGISEEPRKDDLLAIEDDASDQDEEKETDEESKYAESDGEFAPTFIFNRETGGTNSYYRFAAHHKFLKHEDLLELARRWRLHGDYEARNAVVVHNLRLAMKIAKRYMGRGLDYDDLVQEGNIGLMTAIDKFDPEKGFRFTTYATWWVRQSITRAVQNMKDTIRMPVHAIEAVHKMLKITCELGMELQREPMLEEVAARSGEDIETVKKILYRLKIPVVSLDELAYPSSSTGSETTLGDITRDGNVLSPVTTLEAKEELEIASQRVRTMLASIKALPIPERLKTAFKMYYGLEGHREDHTLESIAEAEGFGVTRERIRQMNKQVWLKLIEHGIAMNDKKFVADLERVRELESIVSTEADLSTPTEAIVWEEVAIAFQDGTEKSEREVVPEAIIASQRPEAQFAEVESGTPKPEDIIRVTANVYGTTPEIILGESKPNDVVWARWVCIYIMREKLKSSFVEIGQILHYAEHSTAMYGYRSIKKSIEQDPKVGDEIEKIVVLCGSVQEELVNPEQVTKVANPATKVTSPIVDQVLTLISQVFGVEKSKLFAKAETRPNAEEKDHVLARDTAMYILRLDFNIQRQEVSQIFGFSDDSRVSVICNRMAEKAKSDTDLQTDLALIRGQYSLEVYGENLTQIKECQKTLFPKQVEELKNITEKVVVPFNEKIRRLHAKIDALDAPDRHKEILKSRYNGDLAKGAPTYDSLGQTYGGITRERVRQILLDGLMRLIPTLDQSDIQPDNYAKEFEKVCLLVELQNL